MDLVNFWVVTLLCISDVCVLEDLLRFSYAFEKSVALLIQPVHILHPFHFLLVDLIAIGHIIELDQVFRKDESVVKNEPKPLLLIIFFGPEHTRHMVVHLSVNLRIAPYFRWRVARVEVRIVRILYAFRKEDLANKQLPRRNLEESSLLCHLLRILQVRVAILILEV